MRQLLPRCAAIPKKKASKSEKSRNVVNRVKVAKRFWKKSMKSRSICFMS